jgi:hypothetical protein
MPRIDNLFQFIVPLTFLAIWALTSLLNREAQPLPPRTGRPKPPNGLGPGPGTLRSELVNRDPNARWGAPTAGERPAPPTAPASRRPAGRPDDEILIIEETRRPSGSSPSSASPLLRPGAAGGSRRGNRARPAPAPSPKRLETASPRPLSGAVGPASPINSPMSKTLELNPLSLPASPLMSSDPRDLARAVAEPTRQAARPAAVWDDFRLLLSTPSKLREAIIVNEILQPPLSLRSRRPGA